MCDFVFLCDNRCWKKNSQKGELLRDQRKHSFIVDIIEWPSTWSYLIHFHHWCVRIPFAQHLQSFVLLTTTHLFLKNTCVTLNY